MRGRKVARNAHARLLGEDAAEMNGLQSTSCAQHFERRRVLDVALEKMAHAVDASPVQPLVALAEKLAGLSATKSVCARISRTLARYHIGRAAWGTGGLEQFLRVPRSEGAAGDLQPRRGRAGAVHEARMGSLSRARGWP